MATFETSPEAAGARTGRSLLSVGVALPLTLAALVGERAMAAAAGRPWERLLAAGWAAFAAYGVLTALAHAGFGRALCLPRLRGLGAARWGSAAGVLAGVAFGAGAVLQWMAGGASFPLAETTRLDLVKWPLLVVFAAGVVAIYGSLGVCLGGRYARPCGLGVGTLSATVGVVYALTAAMVLTCHWQGTTATVRLVGFCHMAYGVLLGGLLLALSCQAVSEEVGDPTPQTSVAPETS